MSTLDELKAENQMLKREASVNEFNRGLDRERKSLRRENFMLRHEKGIHSIKSASSRIANAFKQTGATALPAIKTAARKTKAYGEYLAASPRQERREPNKPKYYYKKLKGGKYIRKKVRGHRQHNNDSQQSSHSPFGQSHFGGGSSIFGMNSGVHSTSSDLFRRTI
jgi:hypothetical protein